jgi:hypothetical protein
VTVTLTASVRRRRAASAAVLSILRPARVHSLSCSPRAGVSSDSFRLDLTRHDMTGPDRTGRDTTGRDWTRRDGTRRDKTRQVF